MSRTASSSTAPAAASTTSRPSNLDALAEAIVQEIAHEVSYRPVEADGAAVAGRMLAELL